MLACPKCKATELKTAGRGGTPVLRCYTCHGMWASLEEAESLLMQGAITDPASMLPQKVQGDALAGLCPHGHGILARARVDGDEPFYLDRCTHCQGLWFDAGEWQRLASLHLEKNLADLWDPERRRRLQQARIEDGHRARMIAALGQPLVDQIEAVTEAIESSPARHEAAGYLAQRLGLTRS